MSNSIIRAALESRLKTWGDSQSPPIQIAFENVAFSKPSDFTPFLECMLIPNVAMNRDVTASHERHLGFFQVNVWAKKGVGMGQAEALAESIKALYPVMPKTGTVSVESPPKIDKPIPDGSGWVVVPVLIQYRYEA